MDAYKQKSFEELHWEDLQKGNKGGAPAAGMGQMGAFNSAISPQKSFGATQPATTGAFGAFGAPAQQPAFGAPTTAFGAAPAAVSAFGAAPAPSAFGATSAFGSTMPAFGSPAATPGLGGFGNLTKPTATAFGSPTTPSVSAFGAPTAFGQPAGATSFGQPAAGATAFGSPAPAFGQAANAFKMPTAGTPGVSTIPAFGSPTPGTTAPTFGAPAMGSFTSSFGTTPTATPSFGASGFGLAGQQQQQAQFQMQQQQLQQQQQMMTQPAPPVTPSVDHKIELLLKKKGDITNTNSKSKEVQAKSEQAQQSVSSPSIILAGLDIGRTKQLSRSTPLSSAKLLARGMRNVEHHNESQSVPIATGSISFPLPIEANTSNSSITNGTSTISHSTSVPGLFSPTPQLGSAKKLILSSFSTPSASRSLPLPPSRTPAKTPLNGGLSSAQKLTITSESSVLQTPSTNLKVRIMEGISSNSKFGGYSNDLNISLNMVPRVHRKTASEDSWPVLSKDGYDTVPTMSVLRNMTEDELSSVQNFAVTRKNYGKIEWLVAVDIRGEDLDKAVEIEANEVSVYDNVENVPPQGQRLNNPARITLENSWPKQKESQEKLKAYENKLREFCRANEAKFVSYDGSKGQWIFQVEHFSRYAFVDDDDAEEDDQMKQQQEMQEEQHSHQRPTAVQEVTDEGMDSDNGDVTAPVEELMVSPPVKSSFDRLRHALFTEYGNSTQASTSETEETALVVAPKGRHRHANHYLRTPIVDSFSSMAKPDFSMNFVRAKPVPTLIFEDGQRFSAKYRADFQRLANENRVFFLPEQSPTIRNLIETKQRLLGISSNVPGCTTKSLEAQANPHKIDKKDLLLFMGRSQRAGFGVDGRLVHTGRIMTKFVPNDSKEFNRSHRIVIEPINTVSRQAKAFPAQDSSPSTHILQQCIEAVHSVSQHSERDAVDNFAPVWTAPLAIATDLAQYNRYATCLNLLSAVFDQSVPRTNSNHPDWLLQVAINGIRAATGQEQISAILQQDYDYIPLTDAEYLAFPELSERRRVFMHQWLMQVTRDIAKHQPRSKNDVFDQAFLCLVSGRDVYGAVSLLQEAGQFRLASLIAQIGGDADTKVLLRQQLLLWRNLEVLDQFPVGLRRLYTLLAAPLPSRLHNESGNDIFYQDLLRELFANLHWMQCLALLCWYFPAGHAASAVTDTTLHMEDKFEENLESGTFAQSLALFRQLLQSQLVAAPIRPYGLDTASSSSTVTQQWDGVYSLLCAMYLGEEVLQAMEIHGMAVDDIDYHATYVLLTLLESLQMVSTESALSVLVRQHVVFQLLSVGQVSSALFVLSQIPETSVQGSAVAVYFRDLLQRSAPSLTVKLQQQLRIPTALFSEAQAYFASYQKQHQQPQQQQVGSVDVLQALMSAGQMAQVAQLLCLQRSDLFLLSSHSAHSNEEVSTAQALQIADWILAEDAQMLQQEQRAQQLQSQQRRGYALLGTDRTWIDVVRIIRDYFAVQDAADSLLPEFGPINTTSSSFSSSTTTTTAMSEAVTAAADAMREIALEAERVFVYILQFYEQDAVSRQRAKYLQAFHPSFHSLWAKMATYLYELLAKIHLRIGNHASVEASSVHSTTMTSRAADYAQMHVLDAAVLLRPGLLRDVSYVGDGGGKADSSDAAALVDRRVCKATVAHAIKGFTYNAASTLVL